MADRRPLDRFLIIYKDEFNADGLQMTDYEAINNLISKSMQMADDEKFDELQSCFAPGGEQIPGVGIAIPQHKIAALARRYSAEKGKLPQPQGLKHLAINRYIEINGETATSISELLSVVLTPDRGWHINSSGRYNDEFVKLDGAWLIKRRFVTWYKNLPLNPVDPEMANNLKAIIQEVLAS
jgi:hypothetical protein